VIYAQHVRNPSLYWPFLVLNVSKVSLYIDNGILKKVLMLTNVFQGISIGICSLYILLLLAMFLVMPSFWQRHLNESTNFQYQDVMNSGFFT
jgi:hypothetical protein